MYREVNGLCKRAIQARGPKMFDELLHGEDRGVSPVIGVILMVAITVILAAVIGTFVLNLGSSVQSNVQAGASVECDGSNNEIKITFTSNQNADDGLTVSTSPSSGTFSSGTNLANVGDSTTYSHGSDASVDVTVTAQAGDRSTVISTKTCDL